MFDANLCRSIEQYYLRPTAPILKPSLQTILTSDTNVHQKALMFTKKMNSPNVMFVVHVSDLSSIQSLSKQSVSKL